MTSRHQEKDRKNRKELIETIGHGNTIKTVVVDRHHKNGPEIHELSDTGIITIFNLRTKKMITQLIARPGQIKRYFADNEIIPNELLELARQHQKLNYNYAQKNKPHGLFFYCVNKTFAVRTKISRPARDQQIAQKPVQSFVQLYFQNFLTNKPAQCIIKTVKEGNTKGGIKMNYTIEEALDFGATLEDIAELLGIELEELES